MKFMIIKTVQRVLEMDKSVKKLLTKKEKKWSKVE